VCGKAVKSSEVQYEVEDEGRRSIGCHFPCFIAWQEESRRNRAVGHHNASGAVRSGCATLATFAWTTKEPTAARSRMLEM